MSERQPGGAWAWAGSLLRSVEAAFLSGGPSPLDALEASGFRADTPASYCARCGRSIGPHEFDGHACAACRGKKQRYGGVVRLGPYTGPLREAIHEYKFARWHAVGERLGMALGAAVAERLRLVADHAGEDAWAVFGRAVVAPVPTTFVRRSVRGIDHTMGLARAVSRGSGLPLRRVLVRAHRPSQTGLSATARRRNLRGSMRVACDRSWLGGLRVVVLVDDVMTTGETLTEASRAVRAGGGPPVLGAVLAAAEPARRGVRGPGGELSVENVGSGSVGA